MHSRYFCEVYFSWLLFQCKTEQRRNSVWWDHLFHQLWLASVGACLNKPPSIYLQLLLLHQQSRFLNSFIFINLLQLSLYICMYTHTHCFDSLDWTCAKESVTFSAPRPLSLGAWWYLNVKFSFVLLWYMSHSHDLQTKHHQAFLLIWEYSQVSCLSLCLCPPDGRHGGRHHRPDGRLQDPQEEQEALHILHSLPYFPPCPALHY